MIEVSNLYGVKHLNTGRRPNKATNVKKEIDRTIQMALLRVFIEGLGKKAL